jgi:hypothetical protein
MKSAFAIATLMLLGITIGQAAEMLACDAPEAPGDARQITCPIAASATPRSFRFKANFTGSHDDTTMSLAATVDGAGLACGSGSKTNSQFEDGEVSLECRFPVAESASSRTLGVKLVWRHAQYTGYEFTID